FTKLLHFLKLVLILIGALRIETFRVSWFSIDDLPIDVHWVFILEGWEPSKHLIDKDSQCPPIHWFTMALVQQNLRSYVLWSSTDSVCSLCYNLSKTKVDHLQVTII